ncbi:MAG: glycosyltransferase [Clostridiales Family XIII bacterium]|jgi:glycosyltransferase involved in cell wall biosynthesis|nr:glycosyltransferase [Clostridiales Family XIII bacterium]
MVESAKINHTFAVCAYRDSVYIEDLFDSLKRQTVQSRVVVSTSTPTDLLVQKAERYGIEVSINENGTGGIVGDWDAAYALAETDYVTLAHQDDIYEPTYAERVLELLARSTNPVLAYTDYFEIRGEKREIENSLLVIKRHMNRPIKLFPRSRFVRNRVLSIGDPICCPAITFNKKRFHDFKFDSEYRNSMDWEALSRFAREKGDFLYVPEPLMGHRIHEGSETTENIQNGARYREDLSILQRYWPAPIANLVMKFYSKSMDSNEA